MEKTLMATVLLGVAVLLPAGCATNEQSLQKRGLSPLSHTKLEALYSRTRDERFLTATGVSGTGKFARDGTAKVAWDGGSADGTWRIKGNTFCTRYASIRGGKENCFTVYQTQPNKYALFFPDGSPDATVTYTN